MNSIVGDGETVPWPLYTSRLDIEPELAVVSGNAQQPVAGFCIFNDVSGRDVQAPEIIGGFCLTKDMEKGNQLGPYLVTADEVGDPYALEVVVSVDGKVRYRGSTAEIDHKAEDVFSWLGFVAPLKPGTVMGFGTIPDCTGLDHDDFLDPGAEIEIRFERLGTYAATSPSRRASCCPAVGRCGRRYGGSIAFSRASPAPQGVPAPGTATSTTRSVALGVRAISAGSWESEAQRKSCRRFGPPSMTA